MERKPLPRRLEGRDRNDGLVQLWRMRWFLAALPLVAVGLVVAFQMKYGPRTLESGRQEVEALRNDPIVGFRAPGTELTAQQEHPAQIHRPYIGAPWETKTSMRTG